MEQVAYRLATFKGMQRKSVEIRGSSRNREVRHSHPLLGQAWSTVVITNSEARRFFRLQNGKPDEPTKQAAIQHATQLADRVLTSQYGAVPPKLSAAVAKQIYFECVASARTPPIDMHRFDLDAKMNHWALKAIATVGLSLVSLKNETVRYAAILQKEIIEAEQKLRLKIRLEYG